MKTDSKEKEQINLRVTLVRQFRLWQFRTQLLCRKMPVQYLFVLSTMRSGSTLLAHLLNSHPDIGGYGESHTGYKNRRDLTDLLYRTTVKKHCFDVTRQRYVMDKLVLNYPISDRLLKRKELKFIFLLRDPARSFNSAAKLGEVSDGHKRWQDPSVWLAYYRERMESLGNTAKRIQDSQRCLIIRHKDLLGNTEAVLNSMQHFLDVDAPFSEKYNLTSQTGSLFYGDSSDNIKAGKILRDGMTAAPEFVLPPDISQEAYRIEDDCLRTLNQLCLKAG